MRRFILMAAVFFGLMTAASSYARSNETATCSTGVTSCENPKVALKTNLFYDVVATLNLGVEFSIAPKWTLDISGNIHPWVLPKGRRLSHLLIQPELRWWIKDRFKGHFVAVNLFAADYNVGNIPNDITLMGRSLSALGRYRLDGTAYGAGLAYGYAFRVSKRLNLELEAGVGYIASEFDAYRLSDGSLYADNSTVQYFGPTKGALNIVYIF